jgi:hypothetical protein
MFRISFKLEEGSWELGVGSWEKKDLKLVC